jgi:hypothetical protein
MVHGPRCGARSRQRTKRVNGGDPGIAGVPEEHVHPAWPVSARELANASRASGRRSRPARRRTPWSRGPSEGGLRPGSDGGVQTTRRRGRGSRRSRRGWPAPPRTRPNAAPGRPAEAIGRHGIFDPPTRAAGADRQLGRVRGAGRVGISMAVAPHRPSAGCSGRWPECPAAGQRWWRASADWRSPRGRRRGAPARIEMSRSLAMSSRAYHSSRTMAT